MPPVHPRAPGERSARRAGSIARTRTSGICAVHSRPAFPCSGVLRADRIDDDGSRPDESGAPAAPEVATGAPTRPVLTGARSAVTPRPSFAPGLCSPRRHLANAYGEELKALRPRGKSLVAPVRSSVRVFPRSNRHQNVSCFPERGARGSLEMLDSACQWGVEAQLPRGRPHNAPRICPPKRRTGKPDDEKV